MPWLVKGALDARAERRKEKKAARGGRAALVELDSAPGSFRDPESAERPLLFVHVPRCGGTSLTKLFEVPRKAAEGRGLWHRVGMKYFFYRYRLLEKANFPFATIENAIVCVQLAVALTLWWFGLVPSIDPECEASTEGWACAPGIPSLIMLISGTAMFISSSFLFTAPMSGRLDFMRRAYTIFVGRMLCNLTEAEEWLTGVSTKGYLVHFTLPKMLKHGLVDRHDLADMDSFAVVRNPFSRMVSLYMYNRFGPLESFEHFVDVWKKKFDHYKAMGNSTEEWDAYCHVIPMFEFTHENGRQLIDCVVKQENLRAIVNGALDECFRDDRPGPIPPRVLQALRDMPHANRRTRNKPWQDFYTPRTAELVYDMYREDFDTYGYSAHISGRADLDGVLQKASMRREASNLSDSSGSVSALDGMSSTPAKTAEDALELV